MSTIALAGEWPVATPHEDCRRAAGRGAGRGVLEAGVGGGGLAAAGLGVAVFVPAAAGGTGYAGHHGRVTRTPTGGVSSRRCDIESRYTRLHNRVAAHQAVIESLSNAVLAGREWAVPTYVLGQPRSAGRISPEFEGYNNLDAAIRSRSGHRTGQAPLMGSDRAPGHHTSQDQPAATAEPVYLVSSGSTGTREASGGYSLRRRIARAAGSLASKPDAGVTYARLCGRANRPLRPAAGLPQLSDGFLIRRRNKTLNKLEQSSGGMIAV